MCGSSGGVTSGAAFRLLMPGLGLILDSDTEDFAQSLQNGRATIFPRIDLGRLTEQFLDQLSKLHRNRLIALVDRSYILDEARERRGEDGDRRTGVLSWSAHG